MTSKNKSVKWYFLISLFVIRSNSKMVFLNQFICNQKQSHFVSQARETWRRENVSQVGGNYWPAWHNATHIQKFRGMVSTLQGEAHSCNFGSYLQEDTLHFHLCIRISSHIRRTWLIYVKQLLQCSMLRQPVHTVTTASV